MNKLAVIGQPVEHSLSPFIHHLFGEQLGIPVDYGKLASTPESFANDVAHFFEHGGTGLSVTVPFKEQLYGLGFPATLNVSRCGAANTIYWQNDALHLDSTDGLGLVHDLAAQGVELEGASLFIFGAGGAVRSVLHALFEYGAGHIYLCNRNPERAQQLVGDLALSHLSWIKEQDIAQFNEPVDLVINGTASSLSGQLPNGCSTILSGAKAAYDMAYVPGQTVFNQVAAEQGVKTCLDGAGMLVAQAALQFYRWFQVPPAAAPVLAALREHLKTRV